GGAEGRGRAEGLILRLVQRSGESLLRDSQGGPEGGPRPADAGGAGDEGVGDSDDPGLLAAGAGAQRAQLRDLARAAAAGVASGGEEANHFLHEQYMAEFNRRFAVPAAEVGTAFVLARRRDLDRVFSLQHERVVNR